MLGRAVSQPCSVLADGIVAVAEFGEDDVEVVAVGLRHGCGVARCGLVEDAGATAW